MIKYTVAIMVILTLSISFAGITPVSAEQLSDKDIDNLLEESYNLHVLVEDAKDKLGENTSPRLEKLESKFANNVAVLNEYGYITTDQLEEDPMKYDKESQREIADVILQGECNCDNIVYVDGGYFSIEWWIFWDYHTSDSGAAQALGFVGDATTVDTHLVDDYNQIKPVIRTHLSMPGSSTLSYDYVYVGNQVAGHVGSFSSSGITTIVYTVDTLNNVDAGDYISIDFTVLSLSP